MKNPPLPIWAALAAWAMTGLGCSSMPLLPKDSNLATVGYVEEVNKRNLEDTLPSSIDSALVDDRKQISQLQQRVLAQESQLEQASAQLAALSKALDQYAQQMNSQADTFRNLADGFEETTSRLDQTLTALPTDTLKLLSQALQDYLATREAAKEESKAAEAPAPAPESAEKS